MVLFPCSGCCESLCEEDWIQHILSEDGLDIARFICSSSPTPLMCELAYQSTILVDCEYSASKEYTDSIVGTSATYYRSPAWDRQVVPFVFVDFLSANGRPNDFQYLPDPAFFGNERPIPMASLSPSCEGYQPFLRWDASNRVYAGPSVNVRSPCSNSQGGHAVDCTMGFPNGLDRYSSADWEFGC